MAELKLGRLPDRTPVKLTISLMPNLHIALIDYAALYARIHGRDYPITELVPAMLSAFREGYRAVNRTRASGK